MGRYEFNEETCQKLLGYDSVALGMGLGVSESVYKTVLYLFEKYKGRLLLDADALNSLATFGSIEDFSKIKECEVVITPHIKELSRLVGVSVSDLQKQPLGYGMELTEKYPITLLQKGASTLIFKGSKAVLTTRGCSAQAKGGSGDVLSGLIAGLLAQGVNCFDGAALGSYLLGVSAENSAKKSSEYSAAPSDFIACFGEAFSSIV